MKKRFFLGIQKKTLREKTNSRNPEKAKEMGDNGRKIAFDKYNWDNEGEKLVKLYQQF